MELNPPLENWNNVTQQQSHQDRPDNCKSWNRQENESDSGSDNDAKYNPEISATVFCIGLQLEKCFSPSKW